MEPHTVYYVQSRGINLTYPILKRFLSMFVTGGVNHIFAKSSTIFSDVGSSRQFAWSCCDGQPALPSLVSSISKVSIDEPVCRNASRECDRGRFCNLSRRMLHWWRTHSEVLNSSSFGFWYVCREVFYSKSVKVSGQAQAIYVMWKEQWLHLKLDSSAFESLWFSATRWSLVWKGGTGLMKAALVYLSGVKSRRLKLSLRICVHPLSAVCTEVWRTYAVESVSDAVRLLLVRSITASSAPQLVWSLERKGGKLRCELDTSEAMWCNWGWGKIFGTRAQEGMEWAGMVCKDGFRKEDGEWVSCR